MLAKLVGTRTDLVGLFLRAANAAVFIMHGYGKLFGGTGRFSQTVAGLGLPAPVVFAVAVALIEFVGGIFVALGLMTRWVALLQAVVMGVGIYHHTSRNDPFIGGWELAFVMLMTSLGLVFLGPGRPSFDRNVLKREL